MDCAAASLAGAMNAVLGISRGHPAFITSYVILLSFIFTELVLHADGM